GRCDCFCACHATSSKSKAAAGALCRNNRRAPASAATQEKAWRFECAKQARLSINRKGRCRFVAEDNMSDEAVADLVAPLTLGVIPPLPTGPLSRPAIEGLLLGR